MKKKIKTWLIHLLGGVTVEESKNSGKGYYRIGMLFTLADLKHYAESLNGKYNPDTLQVEPVKPKCPFKPFDKVLVRDNDEGEWYANYFSHYKENNDCPYVCIDNSYIYCIPYEGNEHLLGTSEAYTEGGSE
jgi:hypothetical protein